MNTDHHETRLRELFQEQRRLDQAGLPPFARLAAAPAARAEPAGVLWLRPLAVAALAMACVGLTLCLPHPPALTVETNGWAALSAWTPATDTLKTASLSTWNGSLQQPSDTWMTSWQPESAATKQ